MEEKEPLTVVDTVESDSVNYYPNKDGEKFTRGVTITGGWVDTHVGQQFDLQYFIEVRRPSGGWTPLLKPLGKEFIAGNGAKIDLNIREELPPDSRIRVKVRNEDTNGYEYDVNMMLNLDYDKLGSITEMFGGIL